MCNVYGLRKCATTISQCTASVCVCVCSVFRYSNTFTILHNRHSLLFRSPHAKNMCMRCHTHIERIGIEQRHTHGTVCIGIHYIGICTVYKVLEN